MEFVGYFAALMMGLSLGLIGGGGSILTVPILVYLFSQDPLVATTGSLLVVGLTAMVGALLSVRKKMVDFKTVILFAIPSFPTCDGMCSIVRLTTCACVVRQTIATAHESGLTSAWHATK